MTRMNIDDDEPPMGDDEEYAAFVELKRRERKASSEAEVRLRRGAPFPDILQGLWVNEMDGEHDLVIQGSEILWQSTPRAYVDKMLVTYEEDRVHIDIVFPEDEEEDTETSLLLEDGALIVANFHEVRILVRSEA
jgi:dihydrofolate reductase